MSTGLLASLTNRCIACPVDVARVPLAGPLATSQATDSGLGSSFRGTPWPSARETAAQGDTGASIETRDRGRRWACGDALLDDALAAPECGCASQAAGDEPAAPWLSGRSLERDADALPLATRRLDWTSVRASASALRPRAAPACLRRPAWATLSQGSSASGARAGLSAGAEAPSMERARTAGAIAESSTASGKPAAARRQRIL
mmetsp:Transcript_42236/g.111675  ORF Transcript_42236/g.111675 Transcript_42236/m.111675 type:complete len:204 (-) Transcript_42236:74-685(-)